MSYSGRRGALMVRRARRTAKRLSGLAASLGKELGRAILALGVALAWSLLVVVA